MRKPMFSLTLPKGIDLKTLNFKHLPALSWPAVAATMEASSYSLFCKYFFRNFFPRLFYFVLPFVHLRLVSI